MAAFQWFETEPGFAYTLTIDAGLGGMFAAFLRRLKVSDDWQLVWATADGGPGKYAVIGSHLNHANAQVIAVQYLANWMRGAADALEKQLESLSLS